MDGSVSVDRRGFEEKITTKEEEKKVRYNKVYKKNYQETIDTALDTS